MEIKNPLNKNDSSQSEFRKLRKETLRAGNKLAKSEYIPRSEFERVVRQSHKSVCGWKIKHFDMDTAATALMMKPGPIPYLCSNCGMIHLGKEPDWMKKASKCLRD